MKMKAEPEGVVKVKQELGQPTIPHICAMLKAGSSSGAGAEPKGATKTVGGELQLGVNAEPNGATKTDRGELQLDDDAEPKGVATAVEGELHAESKGDPRKVSAIWQYRKRFAPDHVLAEWGRINLLPKVKNPKKREFCEEVAKITDNDYDASQYFEKIRRVESINEDGTTYKWVSWAKIEWEYGPVLAMELAQSGGIKGRDHTLLSKELLN